ncbi:class II fructose-1,6-bisphosphate aldolase [Paenibacillus thiaminolyticus]|uniref:Class II fructose-1,6-bisphosphate aldolase n=1 Tax=Paenibacillus thiaminolyticus TaxID=49283 RepID=A0AAJ1G7R3_PANTH|nr:class II fructose-1,6-bisphosphate aldolase [Paenibacillus thiaminolyticus]MCY9535506.1 class II fructose-1,6-bisphosphate aldolase [Paenibacillus thiaminolyticus]MCY9604886.1 class II fructose-1,6-bisphosphate aldolase [Paenibacillus thiaminolyticus]MCY9610073.1 class II fructose-1,6-bisphosphate aldolase [Paenibacillus thiaminolyticus]MCY9616156.1 class II fructose-1,6-bisphosphate aldolase [Paenibacillus thiaminolyticus]MCY9621081.1 class II fructose-1,6-bisphosphate aldolase [Paenibacil
MPLVSMNEFLPKAKAGKFAVGQFNINNLEFTQAITEAAMEENAPIIFGVSEGALRYMGMEYTVAMAQAAAKKSGLPIALHLDHGSTFEVAMACIRAGFSSVMFDGSHHAYEDNIRLTKEVVKAAHAMGVSVEGELGTIGGVEDDLEVDEASAQLAKPDEAIRFYEETGVDALAIAVGTAHGMYKGEPKLHYDIIEAVASKIPVPVVLHGGSGVPDESIRKAIAAGAGKINVNTENQVACTAAIREALAKDADVIDPRKYLTPARKAMVEVVRGKIRLFGSNNQA